MPINRIDQWRKFNQQVIKHIELYANVQYSSKDGDDQAASFTIEDCFRNMERYMNRRHANTRGHREKLRDVIKIAHYASFIYDKLKAELNEPDVY